MTHKDQMIESISTVAAITRTEARKVLDYYLEIGAAKFTIRGITLDHGALLDPTIIRDALKLADVR